MYSFDVNTVWRVKSLPEGLRVHIAEDERTLVAPFIGGAWHGAADALDLLATVVAEVGPGNVTWMALTDGKGVRLLSSSTPRYERLWTRSVAPHGLAVLAVPSNRPKETVKLIIGAVRCPVHGPQVDAEYRAQDPAPCGCAWVWEGGKLVAVASRKESE